MCDQDRTRKLDIAGSPRAEAPLIADDERTRAMAAAAPRSVLFGLSEQAQVRGEGVEAGDPEGVAFTLVWPEGGRAGVG